MNHCLTTWDFKAWVYTGPEQLANNPSLPTLISAYKTAPPDGLFPPLQMCNLFSVMHGLI